MRTVGALPTEQRCQSMNIRQWLWYFYNIQQEEKEEDKNKEAIIDYITTFINPELAQHIREDKQNNQNNSTKYNQSQPLDANTTINTEFEEELKQMLGEDFENMTELPSSGGVQSNLTKEEFFDQVLAMQDYID